MMRILEKMNEKLSGFSDTNEHMRSCITTAMESQTVFESTLSSVTQSLTTSNTKLDQQMIEQKSAEEQRDSLIIQKLNEIQGTSNLPSSVSTERAMKTIGKFQASSVVKDPLDWSFSFNQSMIPNDNNELFHLLNGFEKNTWTSLDYLRHKLDHGTDIITNIESICKKIINDSSRQHLQSPVTESITIDTLQNVQDKCEMIERKLSEMINGHSFWPSNCTIKPFIHKSVIDLSHDKSDSSNFHQHPGVNQTPM